MRPERLELEGFTAFRTRQVVDFTEVDLCAFSGATGAGKSSLIDAMIFALYGSVPRYDDRRAVAPVISQGRNEARVRLDFLAAGQRYSAVRVVRLLPSGGATTKEARLVWHRADGSDEVVAGTADEVSSVVEQVLGLSYEHFTTCVVLPQGAFARFLHHKPKDRQGLLVELLDLGLYDRMQSLARERAAAAKGRKDTGVRSLGDLATVTPEQRTLLATRLEGLDGLRSRLDGEQDALDLLRTAEDRARQDAVEARRLASLLGRVVRPADVATISEAVSAAEAALVAARADVTRAETLDGEARALLESLPARSALEAGLAAHEQLLRQERLVVRGEEALVAATARFELAGTEAAVVELRRAQAEAELERARRTDLAAALLATLAPGDPCPVCGGTVGAATEGHQPAGAGAVAEARRGLDEATKAEKAAAAALQDARVERARVEEKLTGVRDTLATLTATVALLDPPDALREQLDRIGVATATAEQARVAVQAARRRVATAESAVEAARGAVAAAWTAFDGVRDAVAPLAPPAPSRTDLDADWTALEVWAAQQAPSLAAAEQRSSAEAAEAARQRRERLAALVEAAAAVGLTVADPETVRDRVVAAHAAAAGALERFDADLARVATLRAEVEAATEAEAVAALLGRHLQANGFQKWVLDEALERLVMGATGILQRLSGGAYSLTLDAKTSNFAVVDHNNADTVRSARTLSGGETFLASLSLALGLADQVVELAGAAAAPLESIFLDEGFGTLDPDTLDVVASAIEELGSQGRLVGVVSHVRDLAERLPVRFEVRKTPAGATVDRVMA